MSFTTWSGVFVDALTTVPAAFLNKVRIDLGRAIDGAAGGEYSPTDELLISGSDGLRVTAPFRANDAYVIVTNTKRIQFESGSLLTAFSGSSVTLFGTTTFFGVTQVNSTAAWSWLNGAVETYAAGSSVFYTGSAGNGIEHDGFAQFIAGSQLQIYGDFDFMEGSTPALRDEMFVRSMGTITVESGGHLTCDAGSICSLSGSVAFPTAAISLTSCTVTINAATTISDASETTRTGPTEYSGNDGYRRGRTAIATDSTHSIDPWKYEVVWVQAPGNDRIFTLNAPPEDGIEVRFSAQGGSQASSWGGKSVTFHNHDGTDIGQIEPGKVVGSAYTWVDFISDGGDWLQTGIGGNPTS